MRTFVLWGSKIAGVNLPSTFYTVTEKYPASYKKETKKAKEQGLSDEFEADPIPWILVKEIQKWSIKKGNIFLWIFTVLQWNLMGGSVNVGPLYLNNF